MKKILPGILIPVTIMAAGVCMTIYNTNKKKTTLSYDKKERSDRPDLIKQPAPSSASISKQSSYLSARIHRSIISPKV